MATIKSYSDLQQSKKLAEILPLESADMHSEAIEINGDMVFVVVCGLGDKNKSNYGSPIWSLAALISVLPKVQGFKPIISLQYNYIAYPYTSNLYTKADNIADACYKMILKLKESNLL